MIPTEITVLYTGCTPQEQIITGIESRRASRPFPIALHALLGDIEDQIRVRHGEGSQICKWTIHIRIHPQQKEPAAALNLAG